MKPIAVNDFCRLKFLAGISFSPNGKKAAFTVSEADEKKNEYRSFIYLKKGRNVRKLTAGGKEGGFIFLDDDTILFPGDRSGEEADRLTSRFYKISLSGGEAEEAFRFPIPVQRLLPLAGGDFLAVGTTFPGFEDLYAGDKKLAAAYTKQLKENEDYEVIEQVPFWWNGTTFTRGQYRSLFLYKTRTKKLIRITPPGVSVGDVQLTPDRKEAYFFTSPVRPFLKMTGETAFCRWAPGTDSYEEILHDKKGRTLEGFALGKSFIFLLMNDGKYGLNTDPDFYKLSYGGKRAVKFLYYGLSVGSSVGSDIRYGGGRAMKMVGDTLYFVSTREDSAYLFRLDGKEITPVLSQEGSVDCFDVTEDGRILAVCLYGMKAQELYDEKGRQVTRFNEKALAGKYVAEPRKFVFERAGHELHGFVLPPIGFDPEKKYPVVFDIHGGPKTVYGPVFYHEMQYWAGKGYFVVFGNPTGSDGRGAFMDIRGQYGGVDFDDLMAILDEALRLYPQMDKEELFETGGSYGGFMTNWIIGHTDRFRACASQRSISNWSSFYGVSDIGVEFAADQTASNIWKDPEKFRAQSPITYADRVKTPTLFIHSFEDYRCPIDQAYQMYTALVAHGVESKIVAFRGENHELSRSGKPKHRLRRLNEITGWFEKHRK